jgi:hypothetical protein
MLTFSPCDIFPLEIANESKWESTEQKVVKGRFYVKNVKYYVMYSTPDALYVGRAV